MPISAAVFGASMGLGVQLISNGVHLAAQNCAATCKAVVAQNRSSRANELLRIEVAALASPTLSLFPCSGAQILSQELSAVALQMRKVPLMRDPWEHVLFIGLGAYVGDWLVKYEARTAAEIEETLAKRAEKNKNIEGLSPK